ncbi:DNA-binding MarR family transcriptional regulator [Arcanobacterium pluranimalium]|uniref:MarR family winged helix-turn-helix transcriptional regulator n=1 Tax=Arcanobacterium pluranimalium TaxID=108028 RepID=UPI00195DF19E|nr:MarR family transcriptional regulator [Arcanobacterium pluranimalium]MBM7825908.1 DNA-binding MarR family transcriptional regulator [Arcanobacterium pluranimalium]
MSAPESTNVRWLDDEEQIAWRSYLRGTATLLDLINRDMEEDNGLALSEYEVLVHLSEAENHALRMSQLADHLVHSRSRLTHTVRRLEDIGYVERFRCVDDGRGINCRLTEAGFSKLKDAAPSHVESVRRHLVDLLSREEMLELGRVSAKIFTDSGAK